jgi:hypothetical protein
MNLIGCIRQFFFCLGTDKQVRILSFCTGGSCGYSLSFRPHRRNSTPTFWPTWHKSSGYPRACHWRQSPGTKDTYQILSLLWPMMKWIWVSFASWFAKAHFALSYVKDTLSLLLFLLTGVYQQAWCRDSKASKRCPHRVYDFAWGTICKLN